MSIRFDIDVKEQRWDLRFLRLARYIAKNWSKDPSTKVGAVIVWPDRRRTSLGINGFPSGMNDSPELFENREVKYTRIVHAEMNALINAQASIQKCTLYTWPFGPCDRCTVMMLQAGITRFVFPRPTADILSRWGASLEMSKQLINEAKRTFKEITTI